MDISCRNNERLFIPTGANGGGGRSSGVGCGGGGGGGIGGGGSGGVVAPPRTCDWVHVPSFSSLFMLEPPDCSLI